ncbi:type I polyketide synthase [Nocardia carnea]|uniref:type I polyketide synthase n=1 Tax=Nocardia carnea TaxID=37328 RepID=UPI002454FDE6|nr:beta-ketoacyl reductase [Nocardia carnea]
MLGRPVSPGQLGAAAADRDALFRIDWRPVEPGADDGTLWMSWETVDAGAEAPPVVVLECRGGEGALPSRVRALTGRVLGILQTFLSEDRFAGSRLLVVTQGAVALPGEGVTDLAASAVWGLVRSAQAEQPGRILVADLDTGTDAPVGALIATSEPEIAVRGAGYLVPRLAPVTDAAPTGDLAGVCAGGTILVTGGTGVLGARVAEHLVREHGARHLTLVARRGAETPGAEDLRARLNEFGATVDLVACDIADREAVRQMLAGIPDSAPLAGVVHTAGVFDAGVIASLSPERLESVFAAKVDGAWNLHELTAESDLGLFALFSSTGGLILPTGQGGYAAANVFLDALAGYRRARGAAATSLAWGPWEGAQMGLEPTGLAVRRVLRSGVLPLAHDTALRLFDLGVAGPDAVVVPAHIDRTALRRHPGELPALLRGLVPGSGRRRAAAGAVASVGREKLAALPPDRRREHLLMEVRRLAAEVLGHASPEDIDPDTAFSDLGFDSLAAIEMRNKLRAATGRTVGVAAVFDYPTVTKLSEWLLEDLGFSGDGPTPEEPSDAEIRRQLAAVPIAALRGSGLLDALLRLTETGAPAAPEAASEQAGSSIDEMDPSELVRHVLATQRRSERERS